MMTMAQSQWRSRLAGALMLRGCTVDDLTSADAALTVADAYDAGETAADNLAWGGRTIAVVTLRDRDTGLYA